MSQLEFGIAAFLQRESLPTRYSQQIHEYFLPFIQGYLAAPTEGVRVLGIHGAQGSGKSTLTAFYQWYLSECCGLSVAAISLDDFYLSPEQREQLAQQVHPLLATRGVPGTHDVALARRTLSALRAGQACSLPRFDKARDRAFPSVEWPQVSGVDVVIFEGWCLGVPPQRDAELRDPINALEHGEDASGNWRRWVNGQLQAVYQPLFAELDYLLMLQAPSFDCVAHWRSEQEKKLMARRANDPNAQFMSAAQIHRFISHYERLTRHAIAVLPAQADACMVLDAQRRVRALHYRETDS